jgi:hypothetical protein
MFQDNTTAIDGSQGGQINGRIQIPSHAQDRWTQRTPAEKPLTVAWTESIRVCAPAANADVARLYAPYDALLVLRDGTLRTVLTNDGRINCSALGVCASCKNLIDPIADTTCRWCDSRVQTGAHGQVKVTRGDTQ